MKLAAKDATEDKKRSYWWVIIIVVLIVAVPTIWSIIYTLQNRVVEIEFDSRILEAFSEVREGNGVAEATAYEGHGLHPIVLLNSSGKKHSWTDRTPVDWRPVDVTDAELVILVGDEKEKLLETCHFYGGPDIKRYIYYVHVELIEAKTGEMVSRTQIKGSGARLCMSVEPIGLTEIRGSHVVFETLKAWLEPYVTGDACMPTQIQEVLADEESLRTSPYWYSESESLVDMTLWTDSYGTYDYAMGYKPWTLEEAKDFVVNGTAIERTSPQLWFNFYAFDSSNFNQWKTGEPYTAYYETRKETSVDFSFSFFSEDELPDTFYFVIEEYSEGTVPEVYVNATISWVEKNSKYDYTDDFYSSGLHVYLVEEGRDFMLEGTATEAKNRRFNFYILNSTNYDGWFDGEAYTAYFEVNNVPTITFSVQLTKNEVSSPIYFVVENPNSHIEAVVNLSATINWIECIDQPP